MKKHFVISMIVAVFATFSLGSCKKNQDAVTNPAPPPVSTVDKSNMVLVPGAGWVPKEQVHAIEPGYQLIIKGTHILKVRELNGAVVEDFGPVHKTVSVTETLSSTDGSLKPTTRSFAQNAPTDIPSGNNPAYNGDWITWARWSNPTGQAQINYFSTSFIVPGAPTTNHGQTLCILSEFGTADGKTSIHPMLQWGKTAAGGGAYWSVTNWYEDDNSPGFFAYRLPLITVKPGDQLQSVITFDGLDKNTGSYNYTASFTGYNNPLKLVDGTTPIGVVSNGNSNPGDQIPYIGPLSTVTEKMIAYNTTDQINPTLPQYSTDYPPQNALRMTNITVKNSSGNLNVGWQAINNQTGFTQKTIGLINGSPNGEVDIYFRTPVIAETDISKGDTCYYWTTAGMVSAGNSTNSTIFRSPVPYTLPSGETTATITGIALSATNQCYYWYADGTVSVGTFANATAYATQQKYALPANETPANIIGMSIAKSTGHVYTWFKDGTFIIGTPLNLSAYAAANKFTVAAGETTSSIAGIGIAGSNDHIYAWYLDGSGNPVVSSGTSLKFDYYFAPIPASFY